MKLYADLHIHSCLSPCGDALMTPNNIVGMAYLKGLDVIAVCDHNSARNLPAVKAVADTMGLLVLPGMELTTREDVHLLCYFRDVPTCLAFSEQIYAHLPDISNRPHFFGDQLVLNEQDEEISTEGKLLIHALDLGFEACVRLAHEYGGCCVPAHINRGANGVLQALGFLPENVPLDALEVSDSAPAPLLDLTGWRVLKSSDAHALEFILEREFYIDVPERSVDALFTWLCTKRHC